MTSLWRNVTSLSHNNYDVIDIFCGVFLQVYFGHSDCNINLKNVFYTIKNLADGQTLPFSFHGWLLRFLLFVSMDVFDSTLWFQIIFFQLVLSRLWLVLCLMLMKWLELPPPTLTSKMRRPVELLDSIWLTHSIAKLTQFSFHNPLSPLI